MKLKIYFAYLAAIISIASAATTAVLAQTYPSRAITIVAPYPPGAVTDAMARMVQTAIGDSFGQTVVIDNRTGAGGVIGANQVAKSPPDGHTLLVTVNAPIVMAPALQQSFPFDPPKALSGIAMIAETYLALAVQKNSPMNSIEDVIRAAKERPGQLTYGSAGVGSAHHIAGELLNKNAGIQITHVPFQGGAPAVQNLIGGHLDMSYGTLPAVLPFVESGQLKLISIVEPKRISELPNLPALNETVAGIETTTWVGVFAPAGTPNEIKNRLYNAILEGLKAPDANSRMVKLGMKPSFQPPEKFDETIVRDLKFWKTAVEKAGIEKR